MFGSQLLRTPYSVSGFGSVADHPGSIHQIPNPLACFCQFPLRSISTFVNSCKLKSVIIACQHSHGRFGPKSHYSNGHEYLEASLLISETVRHYRLRKRGFEEDMKRQHSDSYIPLSHQAKDFSPDSGSLGLEFLRHFRSPTIFLKIYCEGDFLLPIAVGEFAVKKLIDSLQEDNRLDCPSQFQFIRNCVSELGYQVKMVKITERVVNTYYARIYFSKAGVKESFSIDARPSDAINLASRCKAPIFVNKQVFLTDAIRISYRTGQIHDAKPCYDVLLDSASEGPDLLSEELEIVDNLNLAVKEERYSDAAMWRDKLMKLRKTGSEQ